MKIPLPKPGYWERMKSGRPDEKEKFLEVSSGVTEVILSNRKDETTSPKRLTREDEILENDDSKFIVLQMIILWQ